MSLLIESPCAVYTCDPDCTTEENPLGASFSPQGVSFQKSEQNLNFDVFDFSSPQPESAEFDTVVDGRGLIVTPGFVDCHTHSIFAGSRSLEFSQRLQGTSYLEILENGGGILSTVRATREETEEGLVEGGRRRLGKMLRNGTTTVEIKSGYGLSVESELKMLRAAEQLENFENLRNNPLPRSTRTFLGAHTFPAEMRGEGQRKIYVSQVIQDQLPVCGPLSSAIDIFCDKGAFDLEESREILSRGKDKGLKVKAHAEQIEFSGCASLVAELGGVSADHLERLTEQGAEDLKNGPSQPVAVMLPGAQLYLKDSAPPVKMLREKGVRMAVGTDLNPGSSPLHDLAYTATLASVTQGLTLQESFLGITRHAGLALGLPSAGWLGKSSLKDAVLIRPPWGEERMEGVLQMMGGHEVVGVVKGGELVWVGDRGIVKRA